MEFIEDTLTNIFPIVNFIVTLVALYLLLIWAASVVWVYRDIRARTSDVSAQVLAVGVAVLLPLIGLPVHILLRPRETLSEAYERSLEEAYLRRDIDDTHICPACERGIEPDFILCPHCHTTLRHTCGNCRRIVDLTWSVCPYCAHPASHNGTAAPSRRSDALIAIE